MNGGEGGGFITSLFPREIQIAAQIVSGVTYGSPTGGGGLGGSDTWSKVLYGVGSAIRIGSAVGGWKAEKDSLDVSKEINEINQRTTTRLDEEAKIAAIRKARKDRKWNLALTGSSGTIRGGSYDAMTRDYDKWYEFNNDSRELAHIDQMKELEYNKDQLDIAGKAADWKLIGELGTISMQTGAFFKPQKKEKKPSDIIFDEKPLPLPKKVAMEDIGTDLWRRKWKRSRIE